MKTFGVSVDMEDILDKDDYNKNLTMRPAVWRNGPGESQLPVSEAEALSRNFSLAIGVTAADTLTRVTTCPFCKSEVEERLCLLPMIGAQCRCGALVTHTGKAYKWKDKDSWRQMAKGQEITRWPSLPEKRRLRAALRARTCRYARSILSPPKST